jgi:hypothetical protein
LCSVPPRATRGDDVLALAQQAADLVGIRPKRRVEHAVGLERLDSRFVVGREYAARLETGELPSALAYLLRTVTEHTDELVGRIVDEVAEPDGADIADAPLDNAIPLVDRHLERRSLGRRCERHCSSFACIDSTTTNRLSASSA